MSENHRESMLDPKIEELLHTSLEDLANPNWEKTKKARAKGLPVKKDPAKKQDNKFLRKQIENEKYWEIVEDKIDNPKGYIWAVVKTVKERWENYNWLDKDDYFNLGRMGLLKAAKNFDPDKGKFDSYAWYYVKNKIMNETDGIGWSAQQYKATKFYLNIPEDMKARLKVKKQNLKALKEDVEKPDGYKELDHLSKGENEKGEIGFEPKEVSNLFADLREDKNEIIPRVEIELIKKALQKIEKELGKEYRIIIEQKHAEGESLRKIAKKDEITVSHTTVGDWLGEAEDKMADILGINFTKSGNQDHNNSEGEK